MVQADKAAAAVSGRATGVLFFTGFGSIWLGNGLAAMHRLNTVSLAAIVTILGAMAIPAVRLILTASRASQVGSATDAERARKREFGRVNAIQWSSIAAAVLLLNLIHKGDYVVPVITFIVGMHLFPLAKLFRYPVHNVTGTLLVIWATGVVATLPGGAMPSVGAVGTALILLGSAAYTLIAASRTAKSARCPGAFSHARA